MQIRKMPETSVTTQSHQTNGTSQTDMNQSFSCTQTKPEDGVPASQKGMEEFRGLEAEFDELQKLQDMTDGVEIQDQSNPGGPATDDDIDRRSVYVGNVDYSSTPIELQEHFRSCGQINRITIMVDRYTGHPKGYAYIEFTSEAAVQNALLLQDTIFRQRQIKVMTKRKNIPGFLRGRGVWRGGPSARASSYRGRGGAFRPVYRGRGSYRRGFGRPY